MTNDKKPLGYISLLNSTQKPIYPLDDFFVNYIFSKKENWQNLRKIINIFLEAYAEKYNRHDGFHFVDEDIMVETQYEYFLNPYTKQPTQDLKIDEIKQGDKTCIEVQNKATSKPSIPMRASNYTGLSINQMKDGGKNSQIWLLGENDDNVLRGQAISNFRWQEDNTGDYFPREMNMMFVSLPRLAEEKSLAGNLARHILDGNIDELDGELKSIAEMYKREFEIFKSEEEVVKSMSVLEMYVSDAKEEGIAEGEEKVTAIFNKQHENIIINWIQKDKPIAEVKSLAIDLGISDERFAELLKRK